MEKFTVSIIFFMAASTLCASHCILQEKSKLQEITTNAIQSYYMQVQPLNDSSNSVLADMDMEEIVNYFGYKIETHKVETSDGYILTVYRITGKNKNSNPKGKPPVILQHGLLSSSVDWVLNGPAKALGFILCDAGYDVWLSNSRGNIYSREHKYLTTDKSEFWNFSWHEIGTHDLPAIIDFILEKTSNEKLFYIGHSQGTTAFFVLASELPEYNNKIHAMFALAPVAFCSHMRSPVLRFCAMNVKQIKIISKLIGVNEFKPTDEFFKTFTFILCKDTIIIEPICQNTIFLIAGFDADQSDTSMLPAILSHIPAGASVKQIIHYSQIIDSGYFRQYDHGSIINLVKYKSTSPPSYQVKNITAPVFLHYSKNDWLASTKDVEKLYSQLPNAEKFLIQYEKFNHIDFLFAKDVKSLLYDKVISLMSMYKDRW